MLEKGNILHDRYQLEEKLGQNSGRQTWLARDLQTEPTQLVIVKMLAFGGDIQWDDLKLFEREAQILQQLDHPRIPKYRDYFSIDDRTLWFGLVQEHIPGQSFKEVINKKQRFTETKIVEIATEILEILIYLHELKPQVLHRDIKPSNLIWGQDEKVYLVDFGAVQDRANLEGATFTVVGTYGYTPLEQFGGRAVASSDLYALGATLINLITGVSPADLPTQDLRIKFEDKIDSINFKGNENFLISWIKKLTEPALEKRFSTAKQALNSLKNKQALDTPHDNSKKSTNAVVHVNKPLKTKVQIENNERHLRIDIPMRNINNFQDILLGSVLVCSLVLAFILLTALPSSLIFYIFLIPLGIWQPIKILFKKSTLYLNPSDFEIINKVLFHHSTRSGFTKNIQDISINHQGSSNNSQNLKASSLIISCKFWPENSFKRYLFAENLNEGELIWLAQEIRNWLALHQKD